MLTVLIETRNDEEALTRTLASLALAGQEAGSGEELARRLATRRLAARIAAAERRPARA